MKRKTGETSTGAKGGGAVVGRAKNRESERRRSRAEAAEERVGGGHQTRLRDSLRGRAVAGGKHQRRKGAR